MSWSPQVRSDSCKKGVFAGNGLRFETKEECDDYVQDLARRWTSVVETRSVEFEEDPVTHRWVAWQLQDVHDGNILTKDGQLRR